MMNCNNNNNANQSSEFSGPQREPKMTQWNLTPSIMAKNTSNPIRSIVDGMKITPNPKKELIRLTIGDPTVFGNLNAADECVAAVSKALHSGKHNGYPSSIGTVEARQAVADYSTIHGAPVTADDVILTSGCSQSLDIAFQLLANPGQNVLIPRPGFPLYMTLCHSLGIETKFYDLLPDDGWKVDMDSLEKQIDDKTVAVVVNSPSNPCGGVFAKEHIQEIIDLCAHHKLPIISDEVYEHVAYGGMKHYGFAAISDSVPIFSVSSISKRFLVPGWRLGWLIVHDKQGIVSQAMRQALVSLTQRILGPSSLIQGALPDILKVTPENFYDKTNSLLEENGMMFYELLSSIPGLEPIKPCGAMYLMVRINVENFPDFNSDVEFTERLMVEESVFCLPASCFNYPGFFRIVLSVPQDKAIESCGRIKEFCERHFLHSIPEPLDSDGCPIRPIFNKSKPFTRVSSTTHFLN